MVTPRWELPAPKYEADRNEIARIYKNALDEVILILEGLSTYGKEKDISRAQMQSVINQITTKLDEVDTDAKRWVDTKIRKAFEDGRVETVVALGEAKTLDDGRALIAGAAMSELLDETLDAMISDTFEDLMYANQKMKRETVKMVRQVAAETMKTKAASGMGRRTTKDALTENLTKKSIRERFNVEGNVAIIDRAGRRWKLERYADMVTRTKMTQAHAEGTRTEALERDVDLAIISSHNATDACSYFEGQVISMNGTTEGFPTYDELRRSNLIFHPNCKHKITPIRDLSMLPESIRKRFEQNQDKAKSVLSKVKSRNR